MMDPVLTSTMVEKAKLLSPPEKAPRPMKKIRLDDAFDVVCRDSPDVGTRYFIRYKREPIVMCSDWQELMEHMQWKKP